MRVVLVAVVAFVVAACTTEEPAFDNVTACNEVLAAFSCGTFDFASTIDCSALADRTCDLEPYFDCLNSNFVCDESASPPFNVENWSTCMEESICPGA